MIKILQQPDIIELPGKWRLTDSSLIFQWTDNPADCFISDPYIITDYGSVPAWKWVILAASLLSYAIYLYAGILAAIPFFFICVIIRDLVDPGKFKIPALAHDILCTRTDRVVADGFLHRMVRNDGMPYIGATIIFISVRFGKLFKYKTVVPDSIIQEACERLSAKENISIDRIRFDKIRSRLLIKPENDRNEKTNSPLPTS